MSLPCRLNGTHFPVRIATNVNLDTFPESQQIAYHGTKTARNLIDIHLSNYRLREVVGCHGTGVYLTPSYSISMYYYGATVFFEDTLFRMVYQCRVNNPQLYYSTQGAFIDDQNWQDISVPNPHCDEIGNVHYNWHQYFDGSPPEIIATSDNVCVYGLIIAKISNSRMFRPPFSMYYNLHPPEKDYLWDIDINLFGVYNLN